MSQMPEVDSELTFQLETAGEDGIIEAVLLLRRQADNQPADADALLERVQIKTMPDVETNYMPRVGVLVVKARPNVIRQLITQPEVEMASANHSEEDASM